jgi:hypothetical protein
MVMNIENLEIENLHEIDLNMKRLELMMMLLDMLIIGIMNESIL